jgi:hypothetical protein
MTEYSVTLLTSQANFEIANNSCMEELSDEILEIIAGGSRMVTCTTYRCGSCCSGDKYCCNNDPNINNT